MDKREKIAMVFARHNAARKQWPVGRSDLAAADEILAILALEDHTPEGWVLAPREPTEAMVAAASDPVWEFSPDYAPTKSDPQGAQEGSAEHTALAVYRAMLSALPAPPVKGEGE